MALARIVNLHNKWVRYSPKGAMSDECQDLNALHSLVVDGGSVKIPERLLNPPTDSDVPFILDQLRDAAKDFYDEFTKVTPSLESKEPAIESEGDDDLVSLLTSEKLAVSEYELAMMAVRFAEKNGLDIRRHFGHIDFSAFSTAEKHAFSFHLDLTPQTAPFMWNRYVRRAPCAVSRLTLPILSLMRSEILVPQDLEDRKLGGPLRLQRLYSSSIQGRAAFFEYLREATENFERRLLILKVTENIAFSFLALTRSSKTDDRFSVGVFLRGPIVWDSDVSVYEVE